MTINLNIMWFDLDKMTYGPDFDKEHHATVSGETPSECMEKYYALQNTHDLNKFTRMEIAFIY